MRKEIDLTSPNIGKKLLENPRGCFPVAVWLAYCKQHSKELKPVFLWCQDPEALKSPFDPDAVIDRAEELVMEAREQLTSGSVQAALHTLENLSVLLCFVSPRFRRKHARPASMRPFAVRAWIIRRFHPQVRWRELNDLLFREKGECRRCGLTRRHQHSSPCVKALEEAVRKLTSAMKRDGIPVK